MKKISIGIFFVIVLLFSYGVVTAAPTSTIVLDLIIKNQLNKDCLGTNASGLVGAGTCSGGSGGGITSSSRPDAQYTQGNLFLVLNSSTAIAFDSARYESSTNTLTVGTTSVSIVKIGGSSIQNGADGDIEFRSGGGNFHFSDFAIMYLGNDQGTTTISNRNRNGNFCIGTEADGALFCLDGASSTRLGIYEADNGKTFYLDTSNFITGLTLGLPSASGTIVVGTGISGRCAIWTNTSTITFATSTCETAGGGGLASSGLPLAGQVAYFDPDGNTITATSSYRVSTGTVKMFEVTGIASSSEVRSPSSTIGATFLTTLNASGAVNASSTLTVQNTTNLRAILNGLSAILTTFLNADILNATTSITSAGTMRSVGAFTASSTAMVEGATTLRSTLTQSGGVVSLASTTIDGHATSTSASITGLTASRCIGTNANKVLTSASADCNTPSTTIAVGANPTATVGRTATNGTANTFLRSDGAPALSSQYASTSFSFTMYDATTTGQYAYFLMGKPDFSLTLSSLGCQTVAATTTYRFIRTTSSINTTGQEVVSSTCGISGATVLSAAFTTTTIPAGTYLIGIVSSTNSGTATRDMLYFDGFK